MKNSAEQPSAHSAGCGTTPLATVGIQWTVFGPILQLQHFPHTKTLVLHRLLPIALASKPHWGGLVLNISTILLLFRVAAITHAG